MLAAIAAMQQFCGFIITEENTLPELSPILRRSTNFFELLMHDELARAEARNLPLLT